MNRRETRTLLFALVAPCALGAAVQAAVVTRGPYLQLGTPDAITVRWRTDVATDSLVRYGTSSANLDLSAGAGGTVTEHEVRLSSLAPNAKYFYSVGTAAQVLAGGSASYFFVTSPPAGTAKPTRIWVLGDSGTANANAAAVRDAYLAYTGSRGQELWLMLGDNAYNSGTDAEFQSAVFDMYPQTLRNSVLWPTLGNHDGASADSATETGPYYASFTLPRQGEAGGVASGTEAYYSFDFGTIHFICLDSYETSRAPGGAMLTWLEADLLTTNADWVIAFWHHPPYSKGSHDSDTDTAMSQMRANVLPLLEAYGVDLVLTGHSHSYERSFLLDQHYGLSTTLQSWMILDSGNGRPAGDGAYEKPTLGPAPHEGAVYAVAGSSGQISSAPLNHPAMVISLLQLGSMVLDIDGQSLDARFLNSAGQVTDSFQIHKGPVGPVCGDNLIESPEVCDGNALGGQTCLSRGFTGGALSCNATCTAFDTSACTLVAPVTTTFNSLAAQDGWVQESSETSNLGGTATSADSSAEGIRVGDDVADRQRKGFLSFDTASIPDGAAVTEATLRLKRGKLRGTNPFSTHGALRADVGSAFGGNVSLAASDFQAAATAAAVCTLSNATSNGAWSTCTFTAAGLAAINKTSTTQIRISFALDDDDDRKADSMGYYSGDTSTAANRPQLVVTYQ